MKNQEKLVVYNDGRKVNVDGKYYIIKKDIPDPEHKRPAVHSEGGKRYFTDYFLYTASGKEIIGGEEIFDAGEKRQLAEIRLRFVGPNTFIAFGVGWRENITFYVYRIPDNKPEFLYKVSGGDCSFLVGGERPKISQDGLISVAYEITGTYDRGEVGERYMVLRFKGDIIKEYPTDFKGELYPLNNARWLEIRGSEIVLCWAKGDQTVKELRSIGYRSSAEIVFQDTFLIIVEETDRAILDIYDKETIGKIGVLGADLDGDAFYLDLSSDSPIIRIEGVKRKEVSLIESSPGGQYVIAETKEGIFVYEYTKNKLSNRQMIDKRHSFCFRQENCFTGKTNLNDDLRYEREKI